MTINRRTLLKVGGGSLMAAVAVPSLAACSGKAKGSDVTTKEEAANLLPKYVASPTVPKADLAGDGFVVEPGYLAQPKLAASVPAKPGKGGTYTASVMVYDQPFAAGNSHVAAVNEALGATLDFQQIPADSYATKTTAMLAGGTVPDIMTVPVWDPPARLGDGFRHAFTDLSEKLSGDKVEAYPNLANLPTSAWRGTIIDGKIAAVPVPSAAVGWATFMRTDLLEKAGVAPPKNKDELVSAAKKLTNAASRRWAFWDLDQFHRRMYGLTNGWQADASGTMRYFWEMPQYKDALAFYVDVFKTGALHPDAFSGTGDKKAALVSGQVHFLDDGFDAWQGWASPADAKSTDTAFKVDALIPFAPDGGKLTVWAEGAQLMSTFISKKLSAAQVDEVLGLLNYLAAPYGSTEHRLINFGVEGKHHTMKDGEPVKTPLGEKEIKSQYYFTAGGPRVTTRPGNPDWVKRAHAWQSEVAKMTEVPAGAGLYVDVPAKLQAHKTKPEDAIKEIVRGRKPLSELDGVVADWQKNYGEELRKLYQAAVDAAK